jgi:hypothetical protein
MNLAQRIVLLVGFIVLLAAVLFPPWVFIYKHPNLAALERPAGYHFILGQHAPQDRTELARLFHMSYYDADLGFMNIRIDQTRLTFEIAGVLLLTIILYFLVRSPVAKNAKREV